MKKLFVLLLIISTVPAAFAQHSDDSRSKQFDVYQDSLVRLGKKMVNAELDLDRKNANYTFIKTLVSALKINDSFQFKFDSVKNISILQSPDNKFRIFSWYVLNEDGSYRFYGTMQMNTGGPLKLFPFEDYSPLQIHPEDSILNNRKWYGAQYYQIVPVYGQKLYYVLLGWKGNTVESTKKVIDVLSFPNNQPEFGMGIFEGNGKTRKRVVFEYARDASMMLKYVPEKNLIVFDHLAPPDPKLKGKLQTYGPDFTYDGYKLQSGHWLFAENLDMKNSPDTKDELYIDPKADRAKKTVKGKD